MSESIGASRSAQGKRISALGARRNGVPGGRRADRRRGQRLHPGQGARSSTWPSSACSPRATCCSRTFPGVGKTSLARSLAGALGTPWQRIQFTPDLLPGDVTGVSVFHQDASEFVFHPGPVFANVVLADEINRASPRTQSALLEVMEERQVTVDGRPYRVPRPFLVMATQNPIEMDGTYPLPEAQLDRFLVKTRRSVTRTTRRRCACSSVSIRAPESTTCGRSSTPDEVERPRPRRPDSARGARGLRLHRAAGRATPGRCRNSGSARARAAPWAAADESRLRGAPRTSLRRARRRPDSRRAGARPPHPDVAVVRSVGRDGGRCGRGGNRVRARAADRPAPVTLRAAGLLVGGAGLAVCGWFTGWPELTALGAAAVALVVLVLLVAGACTAGARWRLTRRRCASCAGRRRPCG